MRHRPTPLRRSRHLRWLLLLATAGVVLGAIALAARPPADASPLLSGAPDPIWTTLRQRPLRLPTPVTAGTCPVAPALTVNPAFGKAVGAGPVYAVLGDTGVLGFVYPPDPQSVFAGSAWSGQKVLWVIAPAYGGAVLIRGHRLDGPEELRFGDGHEPAPELQIPAATDTAAGAWRDVPSYTRLRAAGCYGYQVDAVAQSDVIIFQAVSTP